MSTRLFSYEDRKEIERLKEALAALQARTEKAESKAQQFERDWHDAKAEFGAASAKLAATIAVREEEIAALRARLRRDMVAGLSARRALASGTTVIELLRKAIEAYITEGPDDGPNDGPEEKSLAELLDAIDDFNGSHRAVGAKWLRVMAAVPAFLSASADQARALRVAWEAFEAAEYTESGDGARLCSSPPSGRGEVSKPMTDPMSPEELRACRERGDAATGLSPSDVRGGAFTWDGDDALLADVVATADALAALRADVPRLLATIAARDEDLRRIAEAFGRMHEADGHASFPASTGELVRRAEELTRAEETRGDAIAALAEHRHAALMAYGVRGGPGAWRWASDPMGTTLDTAAAWERMLGEMRDVITYRNEAVRLLHMLDRPDARHPDVAAFLDAYEKQQSKERGQRP